MNEVIPEQVAGDQDSLLDSVCAQAIDLATAAGREIAGDSMGEHLGVRAEAERLVTHMFATTLPGYVNWYWAVTVGRAPGFEPTVAEVVLLPGAAAVLASAWVPWSERLQPGDLSPGDLLPADPQDPRLAPAYLLSGDLGEDEVAFELGFGRARVLSRDGRLDAADRWYSGDGGPDSAMARQAPGPCGTCGFMVALAGSLQAGFGVCANEVTVTDGRVVSVEFGCGAHSEAGAAQQELENSLIDRGSVYDDEAIEIVDAAGSLEIVDAARSTEILSAPVSAGLPAGLDEAGSESRADASAEPAEAFVAADQRQTEETE